MADVAEELLVIDDRLRLALFGLECALGTPFNGTECEKVFRDAGADQVSEKRYVFFQSARLAITGRVDEYEPETIWLQVRGGRHSGELLRRVKDAAEFHYQRWRSSAEYARTAEPPDEREPE